MGAPPEFYLQILLSAFSILLTGIVSYWAKNLSQRSEEHRAEARKREEEYDALKDGILAILRDRIIQADVNFTERGVARISQKDNVQLMYNAYHKLGGNGIVTHSYEHIMSMPIASEEVRV